MLPDSVPRLRIGELSRRVGVSPQVLRAWEGRYGILRPDRSRGGYRLYSEADVARIRRMQAHLAHGLAPAEAARTSLAEERSAQAGLDQAAGALTQSLDDFDEPAAQAAMDQLLARFTVETILRDVLLPYLRDLGERWQRGETSVLAEHFASNFLHGRLTGLARGWGAGRGPKAILACAPGERHDLGLLSFGIVLRRGGWRVEYAGADTPLGELIRGVPAARPDLVVVAAVMRGRFDGLDAELAQLGGAVALALAGAGATQAVASAAGARLLRGDPVTEAENMREHGVPGADNY